jgi:hypothetical protein
MVVDMKGIRCAAVLILIGLAGCRYSEKTDLHWKKGAVNEFGSYVTPDKNISLEVYEEDDLLKYRLINEADTVYSKERASIFQNWSLYLDENNNLWVSSSDIGMWVWIKGSKYQRYNVDEQSSEIAIPEGFIKLLPDSHKKYLKKRS